MASSLRTEDPAVAAAMGRCLVARSLAKEGEPFKPMERHPRTCGWCVYPRAELHAAMDEFKDWAAFDDRHATSGRHATRTFTHELSRAEQEARIVEAQAFEEVTSPPDGDTASDTSATNTPVELQQAAPAVTPVAVTTTEPVTVTSPQPEEEYLPWKR